MVNNGFAVSSHDSMTDCAADSRQSVHSLAHPPRWPSRNDICDDEFSLRHPAAWVHRQQSHERFPYATLRTNGHVKEDTDRVKKPPAPRRLMHRNRRNKNLSPAQPPAQPRCMPAVTLSPRPRCLDPDRRPLAQPTPASRTLLDMELAQRLPCLVPIRLSALANSTVLRSRAPPPLWIPTPKMEEVCLENARVRHNFLYFLPAAVILIPLDHSWNRTQEAGGVMVHN